MARRRRQRGLGSSPETHKRYGRKDFAKARKFIKEARLSLAVDDCPSAFSQIMAVHRFTHAFSRERDHSRRLKLAGTDRLQKARDAVTREFEKACITPIAAWRRSKER